MKKIILLAILIIVITNSFSQTKIKFINNTNELVSAAYVKYTGVGNGWESHGWYNVKAGETKEINLGDYQYSKVYIYGYSKSLFWGNGKFQFCIDTKNAFVFPNSDMTCNNTKKKFSELKITKGTVNYWNFNPSKNKSQNNSVEIYTSSGDYRCVNAINYLKNNNINYTEYSTDIPENETKIWNLIRTSGKYTCGQSVGGPIFVKNGEVFFNVENLDNLFSK